MLCIGEHPSTFMRERRGQLALRREQAAYLDAIEAEVHESSNIVSDIGAIATSIALPVGPLLASTIA
jgi:hypothetical protein